MNQVMCLFQLLCIVLFVMVISFHNFSQTIKLSIVGSLDIRFCHKHCQFYLTCRNTIHCISTAMLYSCYIIAYYGLVILIIIIIYKINHHSYHNVLVDFFQLPGYSGCYTHQFSLNNYCMSNSTNIGQLTNIDAKELS